MATSKIVRKALRTAARQGEGPKYDFMDGKGFRSVSNKRLAKLEEFLTALKVAPDDVAGEWAVVITHPKGMTLRQAKALSKKVAFSY
jgi:hypothetical protein